MLEFPRLDRVLVRMPAIVICLACTIELFDSTINVEICQLIVINIDQQRLEFDCECD